MGFKHVQFVDRLGDTFRWKGENVATTEVEQALASYPPIAAAAVYGVEVPGHEGRAGMAAITLASDTDFAPARLAGHLNGRLPNYAVPVFLRVRAALETTSTFKVSKVTLKREGFSPHAIQDRLYVLDNTSGSYVPLTKEKYQQLGYGRPPTGASHTLSTLSGTPHEHDTTA
ncbi:AMP-binding enzyme [Alkalilimnicola ehrlichii]|nr:hypothetical protein [Alkalilimnicola ehrlichii]